MVFYMVFVTYYIITHTKSIDLNIPKAEFVNFLGLLSLFLCFNGVYGCCLRSYEHELEQPLLPPEQESGTKKLSDFGNCGFWSKITFLWLNPLFRLDRIQQLVLPDIPSVPQSETAENASPVLEESLWKQKING